MSNRIRLSALTQGQFVPSTRFRWTQHLAALQARNFETSTLHAGFNAYPPASRLLRPAWAACALAEATARVLRADVSADLVFLQRNLLSTLCTAEYLLTPPFVFDVDDAIFAGTRGRTAFDISRRAAMTICGNDFLAEHFSPHGPVTVLPTAVDTDYFSPGTGVGPEIPVVGWSGSSSGFPYLYEIEASLKRVLDARPQTRLKIVADRAPVFRLIPPGRIDFVRWQPSIEASELRTFTVGIMPLEDNVWSRGKCSFKMLTYMATGLPSVVSPVGMNRTLLDEAPLGLSARTDTEWSDALLGLLDDAGLARRLGSTGRQVAELKYSTRTVGARLARILHDCR